MRAGQTLEMHGNIHELVCPSCGNVTEVTPPHLKRMRAKQPLPCRCGEAHLRMRIMLYNDDEGEGLCLFCVESCVLFRLLFRVVWRAE
jgi:NAD-dependent SIR2 family protein deacetylase